MHDSADDFRKDQAPSILSAAAARLVKGEGSLLTAAARRDDAVLRHERARARRERRANPLLSAPMPAAPGAGIAADPARGPQADHHAPCETAEDAFVDAGHVVANEEPRAPDAASPGWVRDLVARLTGRHEDDAPTRAEEEALPPAPVHLAPVEAAAEAAIPQPAEAAEPEPEPFAPVELPDPMPAFREQAAVPAGRPRIPARKVVAMTVAGAALGAALAFAWPKSYVATSEMLIDPRHGQAAGTVALLSSDAAFAMVDNQLRVLRSGSMLNAAAERLNLAADAEFNGTAAGPFGLAGIVSGLGELIAGGGSDTVEQRRRRAVDGLAAAVEAERVRGSSVVRVSASAADPQKSALIANTIAELYVAGSGRAAAEAGEVSARLAGLRAGVAEAEHAVEAFKAENGLVDARGRLITDDEILRLGERLSTARARTVELNARAASAREVDVDSIVTGSLPEQFASPTVAELRARHAGLKQQMDRLSVKLGPLHPERQAVQAELESARQEIRGELRRVAASLQTELKRAVQQEQELAAELAQMKTRQGAIGGELVGLRALEREAEAKRAAYENALHALSAGGPSTSVGGASLISRAEPPLQASGPSLPAFSLAGALAGLLGGVGLALGRRPKDEAYGFDAPDAAAGREAADEDASYDTFTCKEAEDMNPYPAYAQPEAAPQLHAQQQAAAPAGHVHAAAAYPVPPQAVQAPAPAYPAAHYGAPPQPMAQPLHPAAYAAHPGYPAMPVPHDPWAAQRAAFAPPPAYAAAPAYAPPFHAPHPQAYAPAHAYAPPPAPAYAAAPAYAPPPQPVHTVVYVPMPQAAAPAAPVVETVSERVRRPVRYSPPQRRAANEDAYDRDAFVDDGTDVAIEEIRQNLRDFRDAVEDFAQDRKNGRRYGT